MDADRSDIAALRRRDEDRRTREAIPMYRTLAAAAPVMDKLMTGTEWDRYLSILQGQVERITRLREHAQGKLADPKIWDTPTLMELKAYVLQLNGQLEFARMAMELPKALLEGGNRAQEIVSQFEEKDKGDAQKPAS